MKYEHVQSIYCVGIKQCFAVGSREVCSEQSVLKCSHCGTSVFTEVKYVSVMFLCIILGQCYDSAHNVSIKNSGIFLIYIYITCNAFGS
jgi:hypothetical protein